MSTGTAELEERRSRLEAARDALTGLDEALAAAPGDDLGALMELLDEVAARASAGRVVVALEAVSEPSSRSCRSSTSAGCLWT